MMYTSFQISMATLSMRPNLRLTTGHQDHYHITHNRKLEDVTWR